MFGWVYTAYKQSPESSIVMVVVVAACLRVYDIPHPQHDMVERLLLSSPLLFKKLSLF